MNKNTMINVIVFAAGAAIGSVVTWKVIKTQYDKIIQEEIDSVKEEYARFYEEAAEDELVGELDETEQPRSEVPASLADAYAKVLSNTGYAGKNVEEKEVYDHMEKPYVIPPEEFGELDGYNTVTLFYYADGIIGDESDEIVDIGLDDIESHFGEYEADSVFVRDDAHKCDYEILKDLDNYHHEDDDMED